MLKSANLYIALVFVINLYTIHVCGQVNQSIELSDEEQAWLKQYNGTIKLAPDPKFAPFEFYDDKGIYSGIGADYIRLLEKKTGVRFQVVHEQDWETIIEAAKNKEVDVFGVAAETPQRLEYMNFTTPYLATSAVIITRTSVKSELEISDLKGMRVSIVKGYVWDDLVTNDHHELEIDYVTDPLVGMRKVSFGVCDAMIIGMASASYYIEKEGFANLKVAGETDYEVEFSIAVRNDWPQLISILNKGIDQISSQEREEIHNKWYYHHYKGVYFSKRLRLIILLGTSFILTVLIGMFLFNKRLNAVVKEKTKALQEEQQHLLELNKKLVLARDKAKESERLTKAFLTNISHEVRTPMNSIIGFAQLLELDDVPKDDRLHYSSLMIKGGQQLLSILDSIIQLSKMESGIVKPMNDIFDIYNLLRETQELMLPLANQANLLLKLEINDEGASKRINADRLLLQQLLNNLLSNAIKYTPEGEVVLSVDCHNGTLLMSVADTGVGIDESDREAVFEPFRQVKHRSNIASGAGLGLATAKRIVEVLNGRIWIESNQPNGSVFYVELPVTEVEDQGS